MTQRDLIQVVALAVGGLLAAWIFPDFWARVVVPACIVVFVVVTARQRQKTKGRQQRGRGLPPGWEPGKPPSPN